MAFIYGNVTLIYTMQDQKNIPSNLTFFASFQRIFETTGIMQKAVARHTRTAYNIIISILHMNHSQEPYQTGGCPYLGNPYVSCLIALMVTGRNAGLSTISPK